MSLASAAISCADVQRLLVEMRPLSAAQLEHARECSECGFYAMLSKSRVGGAHTAADAIAAPGILAGLEVRERLGGGAFGTVYRAWQPSLQRFVAVKWIPLRPGVDAAELERMRAEGTSLGQLRHPNVLGVFDSGLVDGAYYLVTELADGSLRARMKEIDSRDVPRCARFFQQVLMGLEAAHRAGIVHCDVKPENILLQTVDGAAVPKLADFGLARAFADAPSGQNGTPAYAAPELWRGQPATARSDLFAAGVVFFEVLTGKHPFPASDVLALRARIEGGEPPSVREHAPHVPAAIARVVEALLARDPDRRPANARAAAESIEEILQRRRARVIRGGAAAIVLLVLLVAGFVVRLDHERRVSTARLERILQLADVKRLSDLRAEADRLWPATPETVPALESWLARASELAARIPLHRASLAAPWDDAPESQWQRSTLATLVDGLETFAAPAPRDRILTGDTSIAAVEQRLAFARAARSRSVGDHAAEWERAIERVARDARFPQGFALAPQVGLVPLGPDPRSGFEEFADLQTGGAPARDAAGSFRMGEGTAIVFVLLPGGTFRMGADRSMDPFARENEGPVHAETLEPFFLSKYEMTQGQWLRFAGRNPSRLQSGKTLGDTRFDLSHPVESVTWTESEELLRKLGFDLPTEAQWEYAARAGTTTPWWTGTNAATLAGIANVADAHARANGGVPERPLKDHESFDDGWTGHAPVGTFPASPFGLHETAGNVWEWVRDAYRERYDDPDGKGEQRVLRGGGWRGTADETRSAYREGDPAGAALVGLGLRPMRPVR